MFGSKLSNDRHHLAIVANAFDSRSLLFFSLHRKNLTSYLSISKAFSISPVKLPLFSQISFRCRFEFPSAVRHIFEFKAVKRSNFSYIEVGIYGYTAYSTSKFGLKGLAEALQQEVIGENIHVSLIFPSDTETPGFAEENKRRPRVTSIIASSSGAMKADEVAKIALNGIKSGNFTVPCNFEGFLLSIATAGLSPQRSFLMAFVEVIAAGILRVAGLCFQWNWYGSIEKCLEKGNSK
ncbi:3-dehydrosphinganine reductase TSC10A isoform X2 [Nicotiana tabacum]|uniref:3-dehydrosphinganine reductase TSC10A isoform X2 n=1 Tax=Nicotiana tabacum TaxID=4097 RepID=A0AC58UTC7_TOBAC